MYNLEEIKLKALEELENVKNLNDLNEFKSKYLGKKGIISEMIKNLKNLAIEERKIFGTKLNEIKEFLEEKIERKKEEIIDLEGSFYDISLLGYKRAFGNIHPITRVFNEIIEIFISMGFSVEDGPEIEEDWYNFTALNIPKYHPARDMQDTFYLENNKLLRTHTSPIQIRTMERKKPPIRIIAPGRVFRRDELDATHSPVFHQLEGLYVDKNVSLSDLKGTIEIFIRKLFSEDIKIKFRPSYFPFTEPSLEVLIYKDNKWLEILGAGMVHPNVLKNCNINSDIYGGFAFGLGIERIAMIKYNINDIRLFYENDIKFLRQIKGG
ncbi:MAG: phenylalanine--tRNA ligase subunit alpha [Candidatus Hydrothermia bacterium]|jgi:phenylalanyl-tRNA synthetase alpha chain|nr:phenylalanine--tRNA ligase subunit alpha [Candidatus Hydrothermia bacterium]